MTRLALTAVLVTGATVVILNARPTVAPDPTAGAVLGSAMGGAAGRAGLIPRRGTRLGAWVAPGPGEDPAAKQRRFLARERALGQPFDIAHSFHAFDEPFPTDLDRGYVRSGHTLLVSWNGRGADAILDGSSDALIRQRARSVRDLGAPVLVRFWWEMDSRKKAAWADPGRFREAWRHVHRLFDAEGAANVAWVWSPTADAFTDGQADRWWPGDEWVDWVGADGYNFAPVKPGATWRSFETIFAPFYRWATTRHPDKAIIVPEVGTVERGGGEKAAWVAAATDALLHRFGRIGAVVWFDTRRQEDGLTFDWRIDTSPSAFEAYRDQAVALGDGLLMR